MNVTRLIALAVVVLSIGVGVLGWFLGVSPILTQAASADQQLALVTADNAAQANVLAQLKSDYERIDEATAELQALQAAVPDRPLTDALGTSVGQIAAATSVVVSSAAFGEAVLYGGSADPTATQAAELPGVPAALAERLWVVPVSVSVRGGALNVLSFLDEFRTAQRVVFLNSTSMSTDTDGSVVIDLSGFAYVVVDPATIESDAVAKVDRGRGSTSAGSSSSDGVGTPAETPAPQESPDPAQTPAP